MATAAKVKLSPDVIAEFLTLEEERRSLEQKARAIKSRTEPIQTALKELLESTGKDSAVRMGYRLTFIAGRANVSWKDEFVRVAGPEAADSVLELAPKTKTLNVQPAS